MYNKHNCNTIFNLNSVQFYKLEPTIEHATKWSLPYLTKTYIDKRLSKYEAEDK